MVQTISYYKSHNLATHSRGGFIIDILRIFLGTDRHQSLDDRCNKLEALQSVLLTDMPGYTAYLFWCFVTHHLLDGAPHEGRQGHDTERFIQFTAGTNSEQELDQVRQVVTEEWSVLS